MPYRVTVSARFEAAHNLIDYEGGPEPLHGHSYKVEIVLDVDKLQRQVVQVLADPGVKQKADAAGLFPSTSTPAEFAAFIRLEAQRWAAESARTRRAGILWLASSTTWRCGSGISDYQRRCTSR